MQLLLSRFNCLDSDEDVRRAVDRFDIRYVYVANGFIFPDMHRVQGMEAAFPVRPPCSWCSRTRVDRTYAVAPVPLVPEDDDAACRLASFNGDPDGGSAAPASGIG